MKDYSEMSDIHINAAVSRTLYGNLSRGHELQLASGDVDYCNNATDAWPIIVENKISLNWSETEKSWCAHVGGVMTEGCWRWDDDPSHHHDGSNPLRAAMVTFLMMKDRESSHV
ncbi:phage protein NinX family protein [Yersinia enterocolitica]|uniref:phage protein NinX family protein n=1 Tax=Yersinia enterocolitica TaxID=630 RepID=UPI0005E37ADE|nr:phage protein NinX family protein [Yersinia enterocolitica]CQH27879.1 Protein of uncharacterised function (DUF2591) [Yersinia enterocolitica]